jgi:signal transduction histidine kinase
MELAIPLAVGVAILRYRLFDIELLLSRTLVYGGLTLCVIGSYVAIVGGLSTVVGSRGMLGLLATGVVAVAVQPLRTRLQARVNRAVYGDRDDPYAALSRLGGRLQATLAPDAVTASIVETVAEALRVPFVAIEFDGETVASSGGRQTERLEPTPLAYQGEPIGRLVVDPGAGRSLSSADRRLLGDLARHAGVALHGVRLTADLQRTRERLVAAREEERRRLRRDLHDSLGPALAGMAFRLDAVDNVLASDPVAAAEMVRELRAETDAAIGDIRRVVHELRPPALDELGLVSALRAHGERTGLRVQVQAPEPFPELPAAVEVAAYRIAIESLTNAYRHADARACVIGLHVNDELVVEVSDDGKGIDPSRAAGVGLASMRERAAELGGRLEVRARGGGGTVVRATLPVGGSA